MLLTCSHINMFTKLQVTSDLVTCYIPATDGCLPAINSHLSVARRPKPPFNTYQPSSGKLGHLSTAFNHLLAAVGHLFCDNSHLSGRRQLWALSLCKTSPLFCVKKDENGLFYKQFSPSRKGHFPLGPIEKRPFPSGLIPDRPQREMGFFQRAPKENGLFPTGLPA